MLSRRTFRQVVLEKLLRESVPELRAQFAATKLSAHVRVDPLLRPHVRMDCQLNKSIMSLEQFRDLVGHTGIECDYTRRVNKAERLPEARETRTY